MNKWLDKEAFFARLNDGMHIMVGGFMTCGTPETLIDWVKESNIQDLTIICNDAGYEDRGVGKLIKNGQVRHLIASHIGLNPYAGKLMSAGELSITLVPQGTLAEQIRAYGAGLGGILTPTGIKTVVEEGKEIIKIKGKSYLLEEALGADLALVEAHCGDKLGNLTYNKTARNFNPLIATAASDTVALVKKRVESIDPECVVTPHIFIKGLVEEGAE